MTDLKTDYKDDVLDTTQNTKRKYQMIDNGDGTVSFEDVTEYLQQGDSFGANDINDTNEEINDINDKLTCEEYEASGGINIANAISNWIAQADMSVGETRRVDMEFSGSTGYPNYMFEITKTKNHDNEDVYKGIILGDSNPLNRRNFTKIGNTITVQGITPYTSTLASVSTSSGKTFKNALLELKETWDALTTDEKINTILYYGTNILFPSSTFGIYTRVALSTSALVVIVLNISTGQTLIYNGGTITNRTDVTLDGNLALVGFAKQTYTES